MAKKSSVNNNMKRKVMIRCFQAKRSALKEKFHDKTLSDEERMSIVVKMSELPRNSSKVRFRNRCVLTGRARGYLRRFGVSRLVLRDFGSSGFVPGLKKSSW